MFGRREISLNRSGEGIARPHRRADNRRGGIVQVINRSETVTLGRSRGRSVEATVRRRGIDARVDGRGFLYERRDPQALVLRGEDDVTRLALPKEPGNLVRFAAPVLAYAVVRSLVRRRRKT
jgi:hypothetical protein